MISLSSFLKLIVLTKKLRFKIELNKSISIVHIKLNYKSPAILMEYFKSEVLKSNSTMVFQSFTEISNHRLFLISNITTPYISSEWVNCNIKKKSSSIRNISINLPMTTAQMIKKTKFFIF